MLVKQAPGVLRQHGRSRRPFSLREIGEIHRCAASCNRAFGDRRNDAGCHRVIDVPVGQGAAAQGLDEPMPCEGSSGELASVSPQRRPLRWMVLSQDRALIFGKKFTSPVRLLRPAELRKPHVCRWSFLPDRPEHATPREWSRSPHPAVRTRTVVESRSRPDRRDVVWDVPILPPIDSPRVVVPDDRMVIVLQVG